MIMCLLLLLWVFGYILHANVKWDAFVVYIDILVK